ncbi:MAG: hypothetical protein A4E57_01165 [Syntrophorhabdaceae bacterium PtaU1.Bin034]|nr:MAG: hypothetical protein A4E57_01165 [Syntrophorhabdaceae bacterium PtaU1.Bin034]
MKASVTLTIFLIVLCLLSAVLFVTKTGMLTETGKVISVDPKGRKIVIDVGNDTTPFTIIGVVGLKTRLTVKGRDIPVAAWQKELRAGDKVTLKFAVGNKVCLKRIIKE